MYPTPFLVVALNPDTTFVRMMCASSEGRGLDFGLGKKQQRGREAQKVRGVSGGQHTTSNGLER